MQALLAFFTLLFSMSHATTNRPMPTFQPDQQATTLSESAPSRAEVAHYQEASVYAESGCITCQRTIVTYTER